MNSLNRTARLTGLTYLGMALCGLVGFLVVRPHLYVAGDAAATAANLVGNPGLARLGIAADLGTVLTQALAALGFHRLLRDVDGRAAGSLAAFGLVNSTIVLVATACSATALDVALTGSATSAAEALLLYRLQGALWSVGAIFFGLWLIPMGRLVVRSGRMPRPLGHLLVVGGIGYLLSAFVAYALPGSPKDALTVAASAGEFWMIGYLLVRGAGKAPGRPVVTPS